jgi:hypothetical protein
VLTLVLNVFLDNRLVDSHGRDKVALRPHCDPRIIGLFDKRKFLFQLSGGILFDNPHDTPHADRWRDGDKEVEVIDIVVDGFKLDVGVMFNYLRQLEFEIGKNSLVEDLFPEFGTDD